MAATTRVGSLKRHVRGLKDARVVGRTRPLLFDSLVLAIGGVIGNCDAWPDIALFAQKRQAWFRRFLELPHGLPGHDTFERVFAALDPRAFERGCLAWLREVAGLVGVGHSAIDGKTRRGSAGSSLEPLHLVSAWATQAHLTLGQVAVDGKSNEITAIPQRLELLDLDGALATIDAIGCQKKSPRRSWPAAALTCWWSRRTRSVCSKTSSRRRPGRSTANCRRGRCGCTRRGSRATAARRNVRA